MFKGNVFTHVDRALQGFSVSDAHALDKNMIFMFDKLPKCYIAPLPLVGLTCNRTDNGGNPLRSLKESLM